MGDKVTSIAIWRGRVSKREDYEAGLRRRGDDSDVCDAAEFRETRLVSRGGRGDSRSRGIAETPGRLERCLGWSTGSRR